MQLKKHSNKLENRASLVSFRDMQIIKQISQCEIEIIIQLQAENIYSSVHSCIVVRFQSCSYFSS